VRNIAGLVSSAYTRGLQWVIAEVNLCRLGAVRAEEEGGHRSVDRAAGKADRRGKRLMICRSLSQVGQAVFLKKPKNKKFRVVTIPASALKKLQAHRKKQQPQREHFGDSYQGITSSAIRTVRR
jgi:hypothetical protein